MIMKTDDAAYTYRLTHKAWWKSLLNVQLPYRRHIQSLRLGCVLEIGCGVGRNLVNLGRRNINVGVDHNPDSVATTRSRGFEAFTPDDFEQSIYAQPASFDTLLVAHVLEHMTPDEAVKLLLRYLPYLKDNGRIVIITPQAAGFESDPTHVTMMDHALVKQILHSVEAETVSQYSFPFPAWAGRFFKYNENISIGLIVRTTKS